MKLNILSAFAFTILPFTVYADWDLWTETCADPVGGDGGDNAFSNPSVGTYDQGACDGKAIVNKFDFGKEFTTVNPCNVDEKIIYKPVNGKHFNIYVEGKESDDDQIGTCFPGDLKNDNCQYGVTACLATRYISCTSTHCN